MSIAPQPLQDLLDEVEASKQGSLRAWNALKHALAKAFRIRNEVDQKSVFLGMPVSGCGPERTMQAGLSARSPSVVECRRSRAEDLIQNLAMRGAIQSNHFGRRACSPELIFLNFCRMFVRIFGFAFDRDLLPVGVSVDTFFDYISRHPTINSAAMLRSAATSASIRDPIDGAENKWWLGIILKVRDVAEFTKVSRTSSGHVRITSDVLEAEDRLVEANGFLINPDSAKGLYTHHYTSVSLTYGFQKHLNSRLDDFRRSKQPEGCGNTSADLEGQFLIDELMFSENPKELIKKLSRVKTAKMTTITLSGTSKIFQGYSWRPEKETIEVRFPEFADPAELAEALDHAIEHNDLSRASVLGINRYGREQRVTFGKNPLVLEQFEFAEVMADFDVDEADLDKSIKALTISKTLMHMLDRPEIRKLTGT